RRHAGLPAWYVRDVDDDAGTGLRAALDGRTGEAGRAKVLKPADPFAVLLRELEARLHEQLLEKGVADLDGGAPLLARFIELNAGEGGAMNAVTAGVGSDEHQKIAG